MARPARRWCPTWLRAVELANTYAWQSYRRYRIARAAGGYIVTRTADHPRAQRRRHGRLVGVKPGPMMW